jgi:hypothetical protein
MLVIQSLSGSVREVVLDSRVCLDILWTPPVRDPVLIDSSAQETVMNQAAFENFARWHRQDLLHEADQRRLAAVSSDRDAAVHGGGASAWRRQIGWALIDLGARLSGGYLESGVDRA